MTGIKNQHENEIRPHKTRITRDKLGILLFYF